MEPGRRTVGSARVSLLLYLGPAVSVSGAAVLLGEHVTLATIAGGALILGRSSGQLHCPPAPTRAPSASCRPLPSVLEELSTLLAGSPASREIPDVRQP